METHQWPLGEQFHGIKVSLKVDKGVKKLRKQVANKAMHLDMQGLHGMPGWKGLLNRWASFQVRGRVSGTEEIKTAKDM